MNKTKTTKIILIALTSLLFLLSCFFMYNFYKCLSGFIANGFREPLKMLPLIVSYLLPVICFLFFFYDTYNKNANNTAKIIYSCIVVAIAVFCLVGIIINFSLYASNNRLGVYESLPSIIISFPYDALVINSLLILLQGYNVFAIIKPNHKISKAKLAIKQTNTVNLSKVEYLLICVLAILSFVFIGSALCCFNAIENVLYDAKYIFLALWELLIPLTALLLLVFKVEKWNISQKAKLITLFSAIVLNLVFSVLLFVFELTTPGFMIHVGKPLFMIAFSVSLPIEMLVLIVIMLISTIIHTIKIILLLKK